MNEATQTATEPATTPDKSFDLGTSTFELAFPVPWANAEGRIDVIHTLRRPTPQQEAEYKRKSFYQQRIGGTGKITGERAEVNQAIIWLWDEIAESFSGYPGLSGTTAVNEDNAKKMRSTHKDNAIGILFECEAEVLPEQSMATFDGGEWAVRLKIRPTTAPGTVIKLRMREWSEKERAAFEKADNWGESEQQGKTRLSKTGINLAAFVTLFDALLINVEADETGLLSAVTVGGKTFNEAGREAFATAFLGDWKVEVVNALARLWRKPLTDSQTS